MTDETQAPRPGPATARLPAPARYLPVGPRAFRFEIGLSPLGRDFGNGHADALAFQVDERWPDYREAKLAARAESLRRYFACRPHHADALGAITRELARRLASEHPDWYGFSSARAGGWRLHSALSGQTALCAGTGAQVDPQGEAGPLATHVLDALALEVQEDVAVMRDEGGTMRLIAHHVCFPNHWAPKDKLGQDFAGVHARVPGFSRLARGGTRLQAALTNQGPWVRFAWGLSTDTRLNHHPAAPPGSEQADWHGRRFDAGDPRLWLRVERQVLLPMPEWAAYVFLIRTYFEPVAGLSGDGRSRLARAVESMDADVLAYKGLAAERDAILAWLRG